MTKLEHDLTRARKHLTELESDLPQYHSLLTESEANAQRLKSERASLDAQAQAKGRVQVAREMLETHQLDIQAARAEVVRLDAQERRDATVAKMAEHAQRTTKHRRELEKAVHEGSETLGRVLETMAQAFVGIRDEREAFALLGRDLVPQFHGKTPFNGSIQEDEMKAQCEVVLSEIEAKGATVADVLNAVTGKHSRVDRETRPLPNPEHAYLLWHIFGEAVAKKQRHIYHNVYLPVKPPV
jgi:DNA repair exonuclease SbcCD ATPase subunit